MLVNIVISKDLLEKVFDIVVEKSLLEKVFAVTNLGSNLVVIYFRSRDQS